MERGPNDARAYPAHALPAYSFAHDVIKRAEADPKTARYPNVRRLKPVPKD
jgi:hypothetical protein